MVVNGLENGTSLTQSTREAEFRNFFLTALNSHIPIQVANKIAFSFEQGVETWEPLFTFVFLNGHNHPFKLANDALIPYAIAYTKAIATIKNLHFLKVGLNYAKRMEGEYIWPDPPHIGKLKGTLTGAYPHGIYTYDKLTLFEDHLIMDKSRAPYRISAHDLSEVRKGVENHFKIVEG